jgi:hypothetical protein
VEKDFSVQVFTNNRGVDGKLSTTALRPLVDNGPWSMA